MVLSRKSAAQLVMMRAGRHISHLKHDALARRLTQCYFRRAVRCTSSWAPSPAGGAARRAPDTRLKRQQEGASRQAAEDDWDSSNSQWDAGESWREPKNPSTDWEGDDDKPSTSGRRGARDSSSGDSSSGRGRGDWGGGSSSSRGRAGWGADRGGRMGRGGVNGSSGRQEWGERGQAPWNRGSGMQHAGDRTSNWGREREGRSSEGPKAPQLRDQLQGEALYGVNPVLGALEALRREVHALYVQEASEATKKREGLQQAIAAVTARGGAVRWASKHDLNLLVDNRPHQGLVLDCSALDWEPLEEFPEARTLAAAAQASGRQPVWLALDEIGDPQNLGAAIRAAYFLGADGVLCCSRNSAPLSPAVSKASAGALEHLPIHACRSMPRTLARAAAQGWAVLGAGTSEGAVSCRGYVPARPTVLVVGNEGRGLRTAVERVCEGVLRIDAAPSPGRDAPQGVDSLNVSVAIGILLHQLLQPRAAVPE